MSKSVKRGIEKKKKRFLCVFRKPLLDNRYWFLLHHTLEYSMAIHLSVNLSADQRWRANVDGSQYTKVYITFYKLINQCWASAEAKKAARDLQKSNTATCCQCAPAHQRVGEALAPTVALRWENRRCQTLSYCVFWLKETATDSAVVKLREMSIWPQ